MNKIIERVMEWSKLTPKQKKEAMRQSEKHADSLYGPEWKVKVTRPNGKKATGWVRAHDEGAALQQAIIGNFMNVGFTMSTDDSFVIERYTRPDDKKSDKKRAKKAQ